MSKRATSLSRPVVEKVHKRLWRFITPFDVIPVGFETDGASVPRILWWFLDPATELFEAGAIHDYWLSLGEIDHANDEFKRYALAYGVAPWKVKIAHTAVVHYLAIKSVWGAK